jgi:hypothetical protein
MHKAYNKVEWNFLKEMMIRLGFHNQWVDLIMECVTSVSYSIRINSEVTESFVPTRGITQRDPLSPYLFLFCAEGLSSCLLNTEEIGGIEGVKVCRNAPSVSHLLFADDSLILLKADLNNAISLKQVLDTYCANSGQLVSVAKSNIFFSPNTPVEVKVEMCNTLDINTEALYDNYLGLPALVGADQSDCFIHFVERVMQRMKGWMEKLLSIGGKEVLLKAVAQSIPVYAMSVFLLPKNICKKITDVIAQYWWGDNAQGNKMHWYSWWKLCFPKNEGGLGFEIYIHSIWQCWPSKCGD